MTVVSLSACSRSVFDGSSESKSVFSVSDFLLIWFNKGNQSAAPTMSSTHVTHRDAYHKSLISMRLLMLGGLAPMVGQELCSWDEQMLWTRRELKHLHTRRCSHVRWLNRCGLGVSLCSTLLLLGDPRGTPTDVSPSAVTGLTLDRGWPIVTHWARPRSFW